MKVYVERCWSGARYMTWRLTCDDGVRLILRGEEGEEWSRSVATRALNLIGVEFPSVARRAIRFVF